MIDRDDSIFWELAAKKLAGEINKEQDLVLNAMLEKNPELLYSLETIGHYWGAQKENAEQKERESALERHMLRMKQLKLIDNEAESKPSASRIKVFARIAVAASIAGIVALLIIFWENKNNHQVIASKSPTAKTITASKGSKNYFVLPDGSRVWLNAGTSINYLSSFKTDSVREVYLTGEAYFEIKHDLQHAFLIHTTQMDIRDIGTAFNVKAYPSDKITEATLVEGSIQVKLKNGKTFTTLSRPNEKITVHSSVKNDSMLVKESVDNAVNKAMAAQSLKVITTISPLKEDSVLAETAWLKGMMVFRNESFEDLAIRMERWYNVTISFEKPDHKNYRFSGTFHNEPVDELLKMLQQIKPFSFTNDKGNILIR